MDQSSSTRGQEHSIITVSNQVLNQWPIPEPSVDGDKEERGRILIVGGSKQVPGALILAAHAALRVGVGKIRLATCESLAATIAIQVPESRVFSLPETSDGHISSDAADYIAKQANMVDAVLIGPGMLDEEETYELMKRLLPQIRVSEDKSDNSPVVILDAAGFSCFTRSKFPSDAFHRLSGRLIMTPHQGEMAHLLQMDKNEIKQNPYKYAFEAAHIFNSVVALKGSSTYIVSPSKDSIAYHNTTGHVGLATAGSGDVLSGIIAGLCARNAQPQQATVWGSYLHGRAGELLSEKIGNRIGFLARELPDVLPGLLYRITEERKNSTEEFRK